MQLFPGSSMAVAMALLLATIANAKAPQKAPHSLAKTHAPQLDALSLQPLPDRDATSIATSTATKDIFMPLPTGEPVVSEIIDQFMAIYGKEIGRSSLTAEVSGVLRAERTAMRSEMQEKELNANGFGIDFVEEKQSQQYRIMMLVKYKFDSTMVGRNRPYVTVLRLTMDCSNGTSTGGAADGEDGGVITDSTSAEAISQSLACEILEHVDLPRRNESTKSVPTYIQRQIFHSAPASYIHNHTLNVFYDAVEAQDLAYDADNKPMANKDTMHYVRFRVQGGTAKDCVVAIEHTDGVNTLRFQDTVCYEDADDGMLAAAVSKLSLTKENVPIFVLIASIAGAFVAVMVLWRQRRQQRTGYSYLHSNTNKLSHVPTQQTSTTNTDAAIAC